MKLYCLGHLVGGGVRLWLFGGGVDVRLYI